MAMKKTLGAAIDEIIGALEGLDPNARATAVSAACAHLGISTDVAPPSLSAEFNAHEQPVGPRTGSLAHLGPEALDIKTLKERKKPRSATEMACVVAYYLLELVPDQEKRDRIGAKDIDRYFKQAKFKLPKVLRQVLRNAKAAGYFDSAGTGTYKLNAVGYNLVAHTLPRMKQES